MYFSNTHSLETDFGFRTRKYIANRAERNRINTRVSLRNWEDPMVPFNAPLSREISTGTTKYMVAARYCPARNGCETASRQYPNRIIRTISSKWTCMLPMVTTVNTAVA